MAAIQLAVRLFNVALGALTIPLLARTLGASDFGVWSAAIAYVGIFTFLADFGLIQTGIQRMAAEPEREAEWLGATFLTCAAAAIGGSALCVALIPLVVDQAGDVRLIALVLSLTVLISLPAGLASVFQSRLRVRLTMGVLTLDSGGWLVAVVVVALAGGELLGFAWAFVGVAAVTAVVQVILARRYARVALAGAWRLGRELMRVALPLGIAGVLVTLYYRSGSVLVLNLAGPTEAGIYGVGFKLLDSLHVLPMAVMSSLFPVLAAAHGNDPERVARLVQAALEYLAIASLPIFVGSLVFAEPLVDLLFGSEFAGAAELVPVLMLGFVGVAFGYLGGYAVTVVGMQRRFLIVAVCGLVLNVALNFILIPDHGALGAAWATAGTELTVMLVMVTSAVRALNVRPNLRRLAAVGLATAPLALIGLLVLPLGLAPALVAAVAAYAGSLFALRLVTVRQLADLMRRRTA